MVGGAELEVEADGLDDVESLGQDGEREADEGFEAGEIERVGCVEERNCFVVNSTT